MDNKRRSSTGRSKILESSINILSDFIQSKNLEDIYGFVINNTLPGEIRSTAWRIFLNILDMNDSGNWAKTTKDLRDNYYKLSKNINEDIHKFLRNEINEEQAKILVDEKSLIIISLARKELKQLSNNLDFFKSEIISEVVVRMVYLWSILNSQFSDYDKIVSIVAGIVYSLYPSILHIDISMLGIDEDKLQNLEVQSIFYYLNTEEHFDADIYTIFSTLMSRGIQNFFSETKIYKPISSSEIIDLLKIEDEKLLLERARKLNKVDRILGFYLRHVNKDLLEKISLQKDQIYNILESLISTVLEKDSSSENIIYFWDCIFLNEIYDISERNFKFENDFLSFIDFIILSYIVLNQENFGKRDFNVLFSFQNLNGKDVVKKAIKLREKVNNIYS